MAGITYRTVFVEITKDADNKKYIRFADWALVQTGLGLMAEMYHANQRVTAAGIANDTAHDPTDMMTMVNSIEFTNFDTLPLMLSGGGPNPLHGGTPMPRVGR